MIASRIRKIINPQGASSIIANALGNDGQGKSLNVESILVTFSSVGLNYGTV